MSGFRDEVAQELLVAIRAGRDLPPEHASEIASASAERIERLAQGRAAGEPSEWTRRLSFLEIGGAAGCAVAGLTGTLYAMGALQTGSALGMLDPVHGTVRHGLDLATPFVLVTLVLMIAVLIAAVSDVATRTRRAAGVLCASTVALLVEGGTVLWHAPTYLGAVQLAGMVSVPVVSLLGLASILCACASCAAMLARLLMSGRRRWHGRNPSFQRAHSPQVK